MDKHQKVTHAALLVAAMLLTTAAQARNPCDLQYDTLHDNYCLHNPSKCVDPRVDWKSVAASCNIPDDSLNPRKPKKINRIKNVRDAC